VEGLGQLANHTCCDIHWNANIEVAVIEHKEENTHIAPMALLRARCDIKKDAESLTRYWHQDKDAWQKIFDCQCCACTEHRMADTPTSTKCAPNTIMSTTEPPVQVSDTIPWENMDTQIATIPHHGCSQERTENNENDYPDSEGDNINWNDLKNSPLRGAITETELKEQTTQLEESPAPPRTSTQQIQRKITKKEK